MHLQEESNQQRFSDALAAAKESNSHGAYVDGQSVEALSEKGAKMIVSEDGLAGAAVGTAGKEKGNIFAVFKDKRSSAKNASAELIIQAIAQGGNKLDCYNGTLSNMYQQMGMVPVARVAFNEEFMPDGWNTERDDHPDIVFWMHNGDSADTVAQKYGLLESEGGYHRYSKQEIQSLPLFEDVTDENGNTEYGYDRAWDYRDGLLAKQQGADETSQAENLHLKSTTRTVATNDETGVGNQKRPKKIKSSAVDVAKTLSKELGIGQDIGSRKIPKGVLGFYNSRAQFLAVRPTEAGNISTTMHEIGHAIADKLGLTGTPDMVSKLDPAFAKNYSASALPGEAFAELMFPQLTGGKRIAMGAYAALGMHPVIAMLGIQDENGLSGIDQRSRPCLQRNLRPVGHLFHKGFIVFHQQ